MKKTALIGFSALILTLGLVAWSPPNGEDVVVGGTSITSPSGPIMTVGTTSNKGKASYSLVVGFGHEVSNESGDSARNGSIVAGNANTVDASTTLVSGFNNTANSTTSTETRASCLIGGNNQVTTAHGYAIGYWNLISADYGCALGYGLQADSSAKSVALGRYNTEMESNDVLVVGSGSDGNNRFDALKITDDGGVILGRAQGDISMGAYSN